MSKVRINDLARELEVKSRPILDALEAIGVTGKTHSSSIEADQAERVREYFKNGGKSSTAARPHADSKPKFDLSKVSKPGDALKAILERKQAEAAAKAAPPRPTAVVAPPVTVAPPHRPGPPQLRPPRRSRRNRKPPQPGHRPRPSPQPTLHPRLRRTPRLRQGLRPPLRRSLAASSRSHARRPTSSPHPRRPPLRASLPSAP